MTVVSEITQGRRKPIINLAIAVGIATLLFLILRATGVDSAFPRDWHEYFPFGTGVNEFEDWLKENAGWLTSHIKDILKFSVDNTEVFLLWLPWPLFILAVALPALKISGWRLALFCVGVGMFWGIVGLWDSAMSTLALMGVSVFISVVVGILLGILASQNDTVEAILSPILDTMQSMPAFAYLIPAIVFFGIGGPPAVAATVIYALPPAARLTNLGIRQVSSEIIEAARSFGSTPFQILVKVQLPLAMRSIMLGINQTIMMALGMVVIAALIGAGGLGADVWFALRRVRVGVGFEAGLAIVLMVIMFDRLSYALSDQDDNSKISTTKNTSAAAQSFFRRHSFLLASVAIILILLIVDSFVVSLSDFPEAWRYSIAGPIDGALDWLRVNSVMIAFARWLHVSVYNWFLSPLLDFLEWLPWPIFILAIAYIARALAGWRLALFSVAGLMFIGAVGLWESGMDTLALVLVSVFLCTIIGIPLGILAGRNDRFEAFLRPVLDGAQTMPTFVYLIPVIFFIQGGRVAGLIATVVYAVPPIIRLTSLGLRQVSPEVMEAARSFGSTSLQTLAKVQLPLALPSIMMGINQAIMMALAMVIITALIGAGGLGAEVYKSINMVDTGGGLEGGLSIVFMAIIMDRLTQAWSVRREEALGIQ